MGNPIVWAIGSGKGGVGKSFVTSSLALTLCKSGKQVLVVDLDMSGPNLHTALGEKPKEKSLDQFFLKGTPIADLITQTNFPGLFCVQGLVIPGEKPLNAIMQMMEQLKQMRFDYILLDLGPGSQQVNLEIMGHADERILLCTPEPSSIEKNYRLIENYLLHVISLNCPEKPSLPMLREALHDYRKLEKPQIMKFQNFIEAKLGWTWNNNNPLPNQSLLLIVNQARSDGDQDLGPSIKLVCHHYFGLPIKFSGSLIYDNAVWQSFRDSEPMLYKNPFSPLSGQFLSLSREIANGENRPFPFRLVV